MDNTLNCLPRAYTDWVTNYRTARGEDPAPRLQDNFLASLSRFQVNLTPTTPLISASARTV